MADRVCDVDLKFNLCVATDNWKWHSRHMFSCSNTADILYPYSLRDEFYLRCLKEYLVSKQILRQSEAYATENCDKPTQTPYCRFVFVFDMLQVC